MKPRNRWKFSIALVAIILVVFFGLEIWSSYFSQAGRQNRELQANYQKYLDVQNKYEAAMKADTYGGKTPEETLGMFIDALKKGDVELASKYFVLREDGGRNGEILDELKNKTDEEKAKIVVILQNAQEYPSDVTSKSDSKFVSKDAGGAIIAYIDMGYNSYSQVWKIENL
jgi:hypothetical protein